jgi:predicted Rossmann-fold nucleotide-binding protein
MGAKFWDGMRKWGHFMMKQGVYTKDEIKFGHVTDSPEEAVKIILDSLPPKLRKTLNPLPATRRD